MRNKTIEFLKTHKGINHGKTDHFSRFGSDKRPFQQGDCVRFSSYSVLIKGRQLKFNSEEWDNYFLELSQEKVIKIALGIAGSTIAASALISYAILGRAEFHHPFLIAAALFCAACFGFVINGEGRRERLIS